MKFVLEFSRSKVARMLGLALVLASVVTFTGSSSALIGDPDWEPTYDYEYEYEYQTPEPGYDYQYEYEYQTPGSYDYEYQTPYQTPSPTTFNLFVRVYDGDPVNDRRVSGANLLIVGGPNHGTSGTTNSNGTASFDLSEGAFNLEIRHPNYFGRDYWVNLDANTELDASLISLTPPPPPPPPGPTPPPPPPPPNTFNLFVRVYDGDPVNDRRVSSANITLVADNPSNPSNGLTASSQSDGTANFGNIHQGSFNVQINHPNFYPRTYWVNLDANTELIASLIPLITPPPPPPPPGPTPPPPPPPGGCLPTPPRGAPMLNIWPVSESGADCTDYPLLAAKNVTQGTGYGHSLSASSGDVLRVRLYVHNGVLDYPENIARNVMIAAVVPNTRGSATISASAWANNHGTISSSQKGGDVQVSLGSSQFLEYVPGSAQVFARGPVLLGGFPDAVVQGPGASLGDMNGCYEFLRFVTFEVRVRADIVTPPPPPPTASLTVVKTVINDNGGTAQVSDFPLFVSNQRVFSGVANTLAPGTYLVSEQTRSDYTASSWGGDCNASGQVSLSGGQSKTCTITNNDNFRPPEQATLTLIKTVINDNGGTAQVSDFPLFVNGQRVFSGISNTIAPGTYTATETTRSDYTASSWGGDCNASGQVTLSAGQNKTCRITNNDNPPGQATLTLTKIVINDNGGTAQVADFPLFINGQRVFSGISNTLAPGNYTATETARSDYTASSWGGDCNASGQVTLSSGQNKTCTITNNDNPPGAATLTLIKTVINDNGGTAQVSDFPLFVNGQRVFSGISNTLTPGTYTATETTRSDYTASAWGGDCTASGQVTLSAGQNKTCTITNNDNPPGQATLTLVKTVVNDNGGTAQVSDFPLFVNGLRVFSGISNTLSPGTYTATETTRSDYTASAWGGDCSISGQVTLSSGQNKTCTITNNDNPPGQATLTLIKTVINDNGGTAQVSDFPLFVNGQRVFSGISSTFVSGTYTATEQTRSDYTASSWGGDCNASGQVTLSSGQNKTCTITNNDNPPGQATLTLIKTVINDNGGTAQVSDFPLFVNGLRVFSGISNNLAPGNYTATEQTRFDYTASTWGGDCNASGQVTLSPGQSKTCTITNNDNPPGAATLTVIKTVINDNGGTAQVSDFPLFVNSQRVFSGTANTLAVGTYTVSEQTRFDYTASSWGGDCNSSGQVTLSPGQNKTCTITNNDNPTSAAILIDKQARNVTQNQFNFADSISAQPGEQVEFRIVVSASGNTAATNVNLIDILPNNFSMSFVILDSGVTQTSGTSFNLGNLNPGSSRTVRIMAILASESNFPCNSTWVNNASASGSNVSSVNDNAVIVVTRPGLCGQLPSLAINKQVRNITANTSFQDSVAARASERLEFRIIVTNNGSTTAQNVRVIDSLPSALTYVAGTLRLDGSTGFSGDLFNTNLLLGNLSVGQSRTITFEATAPAVIAISAVYNNAATATADNVNPVTDTATVTVSPIGGNPDLVLSKRAFNQTKNQNATSVTANTGDLIVYTLSVQNRGSAATQNFVIEDDIRDILELAELVTFDGGSFDLGLFKVVWPAQTINPGTTVEKTFSVRVRQSLPASSDFVMTNVYGNQVNINVARPTVRGIFVAPKTGGTILVSLGLGFLATMLYVVKRRKVLAPLLQMLRSL